MGAARFLDVVPSRDAEGHHMGWVTVEEAFANSSNVGAVQLGLRLQTNHLGRDFGFLARTGLRCRAFHQLFRKRATSPELRRTGGKVSQLGQSDSPVPCLLIRTPRDAAANRDGCRGDANGGVLMKPRLVRQILSPDNRVVWEYPRQVRRGSSNTAALMVRAIPLSILVPGKGGLG